jgi:hypothetical protein
VRQRTLRSHVTASAPRHRRSGKQFAIPTIAGNRVVRACAIARSLCRKCALTAATATSWPSTGGNEKTARLPDFMVAPVELRPNRHALFVRLFHRPDDRLPSCRPREALVFWQPSARCGFGRQGLSSRAWLNIAAKIWRIPNLFTKALRRNSELGKPDWSSANGHAGWPRRGSRKLRIPTARWQDIGDAHRLGGQ